MRPMKEAQFVQDDNNGEPGGEATLVGSGATTASSISWIDQFVRQNLHLIIFAAIAAYFIGKAVRAWYLDYSSRNAGRATNLSDEELSSRMRAARDAQRLAAIEANRRDRELAEARRLEDLKERERKMKAMQAKQQEEGQGANAVAEAAFSSRLPHLPSGNNYRPSSSWNDSNSGGGYRPTGFSRPRARGG